MLEEDINAGNTSKEANVQGAPADIYIHNAGLVIVWPFIPALFRRAGYINKNGFLSDLYAGRAAHLLGFLAAGSEKSFGHDLSLNKILCGLDVTLPLTKEIEITANEKELANSLLESVISQWPILGKTSIDGLRGSFLIRNGKLTITENSFNLTVEKAGYDMLLDHLAWSINTIKLSWMHKNLFVTWR